jgi:hypothetical protein
MSDFTIAQKLEGRFLENTSVEDDTFWIKDARIAKYLNAFYFPLKESRKHVGSVWFGFDDSEQLQDAIQSLWGKSREDSMNSFAQAITMYWESEREIQNIIKKIS